MIVEGEVPEKPMIGKIIEGSSLFAHAQQLSITWLNWFVDIIGY